MQQDLARRAGARFEPAAFGSLAVAAFAGGILLLLARFGPGMADPLATGTAEPVRAVGWVLLGIVWLVVGLLEWSRGHRRTAALFLATAAMIALGSMIVSRSPWLFVLGGMVTALGPTLAAYMLATYPEVPLRSLADRWPVALALVGTVSTVPVHLFLAPELYGCPACPPGLNPLFWRQNDVVLVVVLAVGGSAVLASLVGVGLTARRRYRRASPVARRVVGPVTAAAYVYLAGTVLFLVDQNTNLSELGPMQARGGWGGLALLSAGIALPLALLVARSRERTLVGRLEDLVAPLEGEGFEIALQRLVGDPELRVGYANPAGGHTGVDGRSLALPAPTDSARAVTSLGDDVGVLVHDAALLRERSLLDPLVVVAGLAVRNQLLAREVSARLEEVRASRARLVEVADTARRQVERDLHDGAQQRLVTLAVRLATLRGAAEASDGATGGSLAREIADIGEELQNALRELRELARGLFPTALQEGLRPALEGLLARTPHVADEQVQVDRRLPPSVESAAYFVVAEALTNVGRHAGGPAAVRVVDEGDVLRATVADDGPGGADPAGGGLAGLADRVAALGGTLEVVSPAGGGTVITALLPVPRPDQTAPGQAVGL